MSNGENTKETSVHGFSTVYDENAYVGIEHLKDDLDYEEARVFFDQARQRGSAPFEDDDDRQYLLTHKNGKYFLKRRG